MLKALIKLQYFRLHYVFITMYMYVTSMSSQKEKSKAIFSKILNNLMEEKSMSIRKAAEISGVGTSTINSWRSGSSPDDYLAVQKLAKALGVSFSFLLTGEDDTRPEGDINISEVLEDGGLLFDGFAKITVQRLIPKTKKS